MDGLVDYFAVVGYDFENAHKESALRGKVLTRIPEQDIKKVPFSSGIELFCQPGGWFLTKERKPPTFFVSILTNAEGYRHYCAVHSFSEPIHPAVGDKTSLSTVSVRRCPSPSSSLSLTSVAGSNTDKSTLSPSAQLANGDVLKVDEDLDESMYRVEVSESDERVAIPGNALSNDEKMAYAPKCLVLLSRVLDFKVLKNCLGLIYTVYIEGLSMSLELVIAKMLLVKAPAPGSSLLRFSIGAADRQALQTPSCDFLPVTAASVAMLLRQLGILNVLNILCAALVDQKLLFYSCSYSRLTDACNALTALMYPFTYSYPYIPILPRHLLECTSSPTPFLFGIHSSFKQELTDLLDVICVDLDGGVISIPECVSIPLIPEPFYTSTVEALTKVLCPDLVVADYAYPPDHVKTSEPERLDKEIRAIFLRLFCQLLMGYRSCLQLCRIHPDPIVRFEKDHYLTMRGFDSITSPTRNEFVPKLLESQAFSLFVQNNGPPYRKLHLFDEVVAEMPERIQSDINDVHNALKHVKQLASDLYLNENPNVNKLAEKIPKPTEGSHERPNQQRFPKLSATAVQAFMEENRVKDDLVRSPPRRLLTEKSRVPEGTRIASTRGGAGGTLMTSSRRLEVLRNCLSFIFESKTLEIKKIFQAVLRALKSRSARYALTQELMGYAKDHPHLDNQQFDYLARLVNSALQDSSGQLDENTIAADILPIVTTFYRNLCPTVMQFMYSVVQEHPVWSSSLFWEKAFFVDVQDEIKNLYIPRPDRQQTGRRRRESIQTLNFINEASGKRDNQLCMEIAARELRKVEERSVEERKNLALEEETIVFSQAKHISHRMVLMLVPLDSSRSNRIKYLASQVEDGSSNSFFTSSWNGSMNASLDDESGFDESQEAGSGDVSQAVSKFICKFVDRVCTEASVSSEYTKSLINNIPSHVLLQMESLQDVYRESKRLPPIKKAKLLLPTFLVGETSAVDKPLRAYLVGDGRGTATGGTIGGPSLLPAEGAVFVTNYRIIFIGLPCDALAAEQVVIRSCPVASLFKMKKFNAHDLSSALHSVADHHNLQHGIQIRSSCFQLLVLVFDEEVTNEQQTQLQNELHKLRYPLTIDGSFAISAACYTRFSPFQLPGGSNQQVASMRPKSGSSVSTMAGVAGAKTLMKQAKRKAGLNHKSNRLSRLVMVDNKTRTLYYPAGSMTSSHQHGLSISTSTMGRLPAIDETMTKTLSDKSTLNQLTQLSCEADYKRVGLVGSDLATKFQLSRVNRMFNVCRSYPVFAVVPKTFGDEQVKSLAHCHHQGRFPAVVWQHPGTRAVLLRASAIRSRTSTSLFKHGQAMRSDEGTLGSASEEERFLCLIASLTTLPAASRGVNLFQPPRHASSSSINTLASIDTLASTEEGAGSGKRSNFNKLTHGVASGFTHSIRGKPPAKKGSTLTKSNGKQMADYLNSSAGNQMRAASQPQDSANTQLLRSVLSRQARLYVFGDKSQLKNMKQEQQGRVLFVPIDFYEAKQIRASFKDLLKSCLPVDPPPVPIHNSSTPSQHHADVLDVYLKAVQDSCWLEQVSFLLQAAGSIVDVIDIHGGSVLLAIDDGCDVTPQVSSLAQLLSDPHYRTVEGFQTLIQKEWLSFGHRFSHRNRFNDTQSSGFTPVFLQFLDAVYQVQLQFPLSFEFNSTLLEVVAYHSMSNRFTTFLLDSDYERLEAGILFDNPPTRHRRNSDGSESSSRPGSPTSRERRIKSLWEYIEQANSRSPVFLNAFYSAHHSASQILRPVSAVSRMQVWSYYLREALGDGPPYDGLLGELTAGTSHNEQEATETSEAWGGATARRVVNACYDNVADAQPSSIKMLIQQIERLQAELGGGVEPWQKTWDRFNVSSLESKSSVSDEVLLSRQEIRELHNKTTIDIIQKKAASLSQSDEDRDSNKDEDDDEEEEENVANGDQNINNFDTISLQFRTKPVETRTYQGQLWKQGAYMKGWKLRFFVLDILKHELRQYESCGDVNCKTIIDLKDLESVQLSEHPISGAPKGTSPKAFLELKLTKRLYHFIAESEQAARDWVDNLQAAI